MKKPINLLFTPAISHIAVALAAALIGWYWCGTHKEQPMKPHEEKFKIALLYTQEGYFHREACKAFIEKASLDSFMRTNAEIKTYQPHSFEPLFIKQVLQAILNDSPDVIVTFGVGLSKAASSATGSGKYDIPVIFVGASNAVKIGLVESFESSGNNVTGVATAGDDSTTPYELFLELKPDAKHILLPYFSGGTANMNEENARKVSSFFEERGVTVSLLPVPVVGDTGKLVAGALADHDTVMFLEGDQVERAHTSLIRLCSRNNRTFFALDLATADAGAAIGYGVDPVLPGNEAVDLVKMVLKGEKPTNIPIRLLEDSRRLVINQQVAKEQGLAIKPTLLKLIKGASLLREKNNKLVRR